MLWCATLSAPIALPLAQRFVTIVQGTTRCGTVHVRLSIIAREFAPSVLLAPLPAPLVCSGCEPTPARLPPRPHKAPPCPPPAAAMESKS